MQKLRAEWGVESHQRIVLLPGRLTSWKGQTVLIEAAKIKALEQQMHQHARDLEFEDAARVRDQIRRLREASL